MNVSQLIRRTKNESAEGLERLTFIVIIVQICDYGFYIDSSNSTHGFTERSKSNKM